MTTTDTKPRPIANPGMAHFLEVPQGYTRNLAGLPLRDALIGLYEISISNLKNTDYIPWAHRPFWTIHTNVPASRRAPLGSEWYRINDDGTLGPRDANWDSGD